MKILLQTKLTLPQPQLETAFERLRFALRRMDWRIQKVHVRLDDVNGPRGGLDKECTVRLAGSDHQPLVVHARAFEWQQALQQAAERASALLVKSVKRRQRPARQEHFKRTLLADTAAV